MSHVAVLAIEMIALGIFASFIGSIVGLGGAFVAIPILRLVFHLPPTLVAGTSLFLVTANVASASIAFHRQRRINVPLGLTMGILAIPGSILGALALRHFNVRGFDFAYAAMLVVFAIDLVFRKQVGGENGVSRSLPWGRRQSFVDASTGRTIVYETSAPLLAIAGLVTGFLSSFFGIGGGVLVVPLLMRVFLLPAHVVGATSHFIILVSSPFGLVTHGLTGDIDWAYALPLALGGVVGGQFGAATAHRLSTPTLVRVLAIVMIVAASSLVFEHFT